MDGQSASSSEALASEAGTAPNSVHPGTAPARRHGTTYTWDAADRVITATTAGGSTTTTSTYDPVNRLVESAQSGGNTVRYSYAGYSDSPAAILNTSDGILQQIISLPGGATAVLQSSGATWSYANLQGDTIMTTSNTGNLTAGPVTYNPWGSLNPGQTAPVNTTGPNTLGAYGTKGKLTNGTTGTILLGARTFNPAESRFLSVDPVSGGCANAYTYAFGNPLTSGDLSGQDDCAEDREYMEQHSTINVTMSSDGTLTIGLDVEVPVTSGGVQGMAWVGAGIINGAASRGHGFFTPSFSCQLTTLFGSNCEDTAEVDWDAGHGTGGGVSVTSSDGYTFEGYVAGVATVYLGDGCIIGGTFDEAFGGGIVAV